MDDIKDDERKEYLKKLGLARDEEALPPEQRKQEDRRDPAQSKPLAAGFDRRRGERRKTHSAIGRERYLDMVMKEKTLFAQSGSSRTTEQLLSASGAGGENEAASGGERETATGDQLRALLPVQTWLPLSIHIVGLMKGVLTVAPLHEMTDRQVGNLKNAAIRSGFRVEKIEVQFLDRAELLKILHTVIDLSADRCEKTLVSWLKDLDNGLLLSQFQRDMLSEAIQMRTSDIHLVQDNAPDAPNWIKYRIDGDLVPVHLLPADAMARLTTMLKRDAGLNFGDRSTPKDGRFGFNWQGRAIDVRVAAGPQAQDGEKLTLRLLDRAGLKSFEELFSRYPETSEHLRKMLAPEIKGGGGLLLMSGPTGSGKSTTLYACVLEIDRRRRHVLSIEDPIEYEMRYATQWQVAQGMGAGREFSDLIRAAMRHDPDYIIIGEMRDASTVETALKAAESGHTVISTIHADTAVQTLERLKSFMPVERERSSTYTLAQQIRAVLNQRLIKTLCHGCGIKKPVKDVVSAEEVEKLNLLPEDIVLTHNPAGCDLCNRTGVLGRTLLLEALIVETPTAKRDPIFHALMQNVNEVTRQAGVYYVSRKTAIQGLVKDNLIDPRIALSMIDE